MSKSNMSWWQRFGLWRCRVLDWHPPPKTIGMAGINAKGQCPRCGLFCLMDSQGNWFIIERHKKS